MDGQGYKTISVGDLVNYMPSQVDEVLGPSGIGVRAALMDRGLEPAVDYVVMQASAPSTQGKLTAQSIRIMVNGEPADVNSAFFAVAVETRR